MENRVDDATYKEFLTIISELEKTGLKTSYRNVLRKCGRSSGTIKKCFAKYLNELSEPNSDRPLSKEVSRAVNREIERNVAFINQEQQERIEQMNQLVGQVLADNEESNERIVDTERALSDVRAKLSDLQSLHDDLIEFSSRETKRSADSIASAQEEIVYLRQQINDLSLDMGRLTATLEHEGQLKKQLAEKLSNSEKALIETREKLQVKEVNEARISAELRSAVENLALNKVKLFETDKMLDDMRNQLLESERRTAGLEALRAEQGRSRQKGTQKRPISKPIPDCL